MKILIILSDKERQYLGMSKKTKYLVKETVIQKWRHPGGKLRELGPESVTDTELLAILISIGIKGVFGRKDCRRDFNKIWFIQGNGKSTIRKIP